jgi:8-oxo-dGTP diphosphatase
MWLDAPPRTVAGLLRDLTVLDEACRAAGLGIAGPRRWLGAGDALVVRTPPGPLRAIVREVRPDRVAVELCTAAMITAELRPVGSGTAVHVRIDGTAPHLAALPVAPLAEALRTRAAALADRSVVVATALVRDGAVLAAQRTRPPALAGRWELPGGRVEPGESEADAVVRECREELGCEVRPLGRVGTDLLIDAGVLRVHAAALDDGEPAALEHSALRWVSPAELVGVDWVDADRAVLPDLRDLLRSD